MTWGEFKRYVEAAGVTDTLVVGFIDIDPQIEGSSAADLKITVFEDEGGYFQVEDAN